MERSGDANQERDPGATPALPLRDAPAHGVDRGDRVHEFRSQGLRITWSRKRCIHAGVCVMSLPAVFEPGRRPWIDATGARADAIARVVARCPTGALHCEALDGGAAEATPAANVVHVARHGPLYLHGDIEILDESGVVRLADTRVALCRCGGSANKPLCDGSHLTCGFRDDGAVSAGAGVKNTGAVSGALVVRPEPGGPLQLDGAFTVESADRGTMLAGDSARLCRCGQSDTKPFCDGSHQRTGFVSR